ncbi:hypothetical protein HGM15179_009052, partial [Zosterops borbonicus]
CPVPGKPNHSTSSETVKTQNHQWNRGVTHCTARGYNEVSHSSFSSPFVEDNADCGRFLR